MAGRESSEIIVLSFMNGNSTLRVLAPGGEPLLMDEESIYVKEPVYRTVDSTSIKCPI